MQKGLTEEPNPLHNDLKGLEVITESHQYIPPNEEILYKQEIPQRRKTDTPFHKFTETIETSWIKFVNSFKKHLSLMIIFVLIGGACGLYLSKIVYDFRLKEITLIGGLVYDGRVYDVKVRP